MRRPDAPRLAEQLDEARSTNSSLETGSFGQIPGAAVVDAGLAFVHECAIQTRHAHTCVGPHGRFNDDSGFECRVPLSIDQMVAAVPTAMTKPGSMAKPAVTAPTAVAPSAVAPT